MRIVNCLQFPYKKHIEKSNLPLKDTEYSLLFLKCIIFYIEITNIVRCKLNRNMTLLFSVNTIDYF